MNNEINAEAKLIAIYARVSTARQEEEETIKTQLSAVKEFADRQGYRVVQEYIDDGWSGDILARPALDQMREDAKKKTWQAVLAYDPDRLARRYSYQELVMDELRERGSEILFVTTPSPKTGEERILHGVKGLFAEYERVKIAERFRLGKVRKAREGHIIATEAPYGYTFIPKRGNRGNGDFHHGYYEINQAEARVLKDIFSWVADGGVTIRKIIKRLHDLGIPPRKSKRGVWNTSTLCTLLRNKTYIGEGHFGSSYAVVPEKPLKVGGYKKNKKTSRRIRPEEEWIKIPTPAILDQALFQRTQEQLRLNALFSKRRKVNQYLLSGKFVCSCGRTRVGEGPQHGKYLYYRCTDRVSNYPLPPSCSERGINARIADELVWQKISELMSSPELLLQQTRRYLKDDQDRAQDGAVNVEDLKREIARLGEQAERFTKAYGAGLFSLGKLQEYMAPIKEKISALERQAAQVQTEAGRPRVATPPTPEQISDFARRAACALQNLNFAARQKIVRSVIDRVVGTQKELQVFGYIPLNHVELCSNDRHGANTIRHDFDWDAAGRIPFNFEIALPAPLPWRGAR